MSIVEKLKQQITEYERLADEAFLSINMPDFIGYSFLVGILKNELRLSQDGCDLAVKLQDGVDE